MTVEQDEQPMSSESETCPEAGTEVQLDLESLPPEVALFIEQLTRERDEADQGRMRALADFKNFQRRSLENEQRARRDGSSSIIRGLFPALDHFDLALQNADSATSISQVLDGVRMVKGEIAKALEANGIEILEPDQGAEFDPDRHEAVAQQACEGVDPGRVFATIQSGYALQGMVLRPAKVVLVEG
ncbi:MAG: nucleotide exchange factor GrpE [Phycisphaerales bacterium]|nr:nucleotide exchange factor GrpE [Phycisphaerales bacterium]